MKIFDYREALTGDNFHIAAASMRDAFQRARDSGRISNEIRFSEFRERTRATKTVRGSDEFDARYELEPNPYDSFAAWEGHWFETFGQELKYVETRDAKRVWTLLDAEDQLWIVSGFHYVNRVGYLVSMSHWSDSRETYVVA